jgi:hypothetical protein
MSARRPRQGEAMSMMECVVRQWDVSVGRREVEAQASFIRCVSRVPHRADIAHKALIVTAGFPKYEALRGFRWVRVFVAREGFAGNGHAMARPYRWRNVLCIRGMWWFADAHVCVAVRGRGNKMGADGFNSPRRPKTYFFNGELVP